MNFSKILELELRILGVDNKLIHSILVNDNGYKIFLYRLDLVVIPITSIIKINPIALVLKNNIIMKLPDNIGDISNLIHLDISENELTGLPVSINKLKELRMLDLSSNNMKKIDEFSLNNLIKLDINNNSLETISFRNMFRLIELDLSQNRLNEIGTLKNLIKCKYLDLSDNMFHKFPIGIQYLEDLERLDLSDNYIDDIPEFILKLVNLKFLYIHNNPIKDISILNKLPKLEILEITCDYIDNHDFYLQNVVIRDISPRV